MVAPRPALEQPTGSEDAIVVLGCTVRDGSPSPALTRRLERALEVHAGFRHLPLIMSGGKRWEGHMEAEVMALWWKQQRATDQVFLEASSRTTKENAAQVAQLCQSMGYRHLVLVTCDFHMKRAQRLFKAHDLIITPAPAHAERTFSQRAKLTLREWGAGILGRWESLVR